MQTTNPFDLILSRLEQLQSSVNVLSENAQKPTIQPTSEQGRLLGLALPVINAGQELDFRALAKEAGVDEETARELLQHTLKSINKLK